MRRARTLDGLFDREAQPSCYVDRCFLFWAADPTVGGHAVWGAPDRTDAEHYIAALEFGAGHELTPERLILDYHQLVAFEAEPFAILAQYFAEHRDHIVQETAMVRPQGPVGAMVAGFADVVDSPVPLHIVTTLEEACEAVGRPDILPVAQAAYAEGVDARAGRASVDRLRALLASAEPPATLDAAADALSLAPRTLQHHLAELDTTFRRERDQARLALAQRLLRSPEKIVSIAHAVGFSTSQRFATWFKRETGETPSGWRRSRR